MMEIEKSERLKALPPYLFKEIDRQKEEAKSRGMDIISLGVGDPDQPTPVHIIEALKEAAANPANHQYPAYSGMDEFNQAVARWYDRRFGVKLDSGSQVITLIGSKEGIAHIPLAFINPGDTALTPSPAYPVYDVAVKFAGGKTFQMPLIRENGFLPDLNAIPGEVKREAKMMFINYPNNPTSAVATPEFFEEVVSFARENRIIVCHDAAYTEMAFDGYKNISFLDTEGAGEVGIEFHSLSKTYNMTGWRIGFAAGRAEIVDGLGQVKSNIDSGAFQAIQKAGIAALEGDQSCVEEINREYQARRDILVDGLKELGLAIDKPKATFYVWCRVPDGYDSKSFTTHLLTKAGIVVTPGNGFGEPGQGYVRMALTVDTNRMKEVVDRVKTIGF